MRPHAYVLAVPDLDRTVRYFVDVLGFHPKWRDGNNWQSLTRGEVRVMLGHCPDALSPREIGDHNYFAYILWTTWTRCTPSLSARVQLSFIPRLTGRGADARWLP